MTPDLAAWGGGEVLRPLAGGARSRLYLVRGRFGLAVARASGESRASLAWLDRVQGLAERAGLIVPRMIPACGGALSRGGWVVEAFLDGAPGRPCDLPGLRVAIGRLHRLTRGLPDRPGHPAAGVARGVPPGLAAQCRSVLPGGVFGAVHGDLHAGNLLRLPGGRLALLDWDEARRDRVAIDLLAVARGQGSPAHLALEVIACWQAEPARARLLARRLRLALSGRGVWP